MEKITKEQITDLLNKYVSKVGSQNKASKILKNVSNGTISNMQAGKWESISDEKWLTVAKQIGYTADNVWLHADITGYTALSGIFNDSRLNTTVFGITIHQGGGKTHTLEEFASQYENVIYVKCLSEITPRVFYTDLLRAIGKTPDHYSLCEIIRQFVSEVRRLVNPIIIIDELEKVKPNVFVQFIDLFNELEDICGIVLMGTKKLREKIESGIKRGKMCYSEILDRIGGQFIDIPGPSKKDIMAVARKNGIENTEELEYVALECKNSNSEYSLRRVKRMVHKLKSQKQAA